MSSEGESRNFLASVTLQGGPKALATRAAIEVEFALVLARMIDSLKHDPEQMRNAIYELARHKLEEQLAQADDGEVQHTKNALEVAIRGVEVFFQKDGDADRSLKQAPPTPTISAEVAYPSRQNAYSPPTHAANARPLEVMSTVTSPAKGQTLAPTFRLMTVFAVFFIGVVAVQQRAEVSSLFHGVRVEDPSTNSVTVRIPQPSTDSPQPQLEMPKVSPLLPTAYGIYAVSDGKLFELKSLPGRAPDIRVAISAAIEGPSQTTLPSGKVKFIVFRRELSSNGTDRAEVRLIAKVTRVMSYDGEGKPNVSDEDKWVIRNISFPYRMAPIKDNPEMDEVASEDPEAELSPGRYALVLKNQTYDFSIAGPLTDPRHCLERLTASNGTFYSQCSIRPSLRR